MNREELMEIVDELLEELKKKAIAPRDAKNIAQLFSEKVDENIQNGVAEYMNNGTFV